MPNRLIPFNQCFYGERLAQSLLDFAVATHQPRFIGKHSLTSKNHERK